VIGGVEALSTTSTNKVAPTDKLAIGSDRIHMEIKFRAGLGTLMYNLNLNKNNGNPLQTVLTISNSDV
jgi:hypothetical protein